MPYNKASYRQYWRDRAQELKTINHAIWGFAGAAALIEHGTKLANGGQGGRTRYKNFVKTFGSRYVNFRYAVNGTDDLDVQIYHTFRCGLLHSFSLVADNQGVDAGARDGSIALCSLNDNGVTQALHCTQYTSYGMDACRLVLEPFVEDIGNAIDRLFDDPNLDAGIEQNHIDHPPFNAFA